MAFFYATKVSVVDQETIVSVNETLQDVLSDVKNHSFLQVADNPIVEIKTTFKDDQGNQKIELVKPWAYGSVVDQPCLAAPTAAELAELIEKIRSLINRSEDILAENRALKLQLLGNGIYTTIDEAMQEVGNGSYFAVPSEDPDIFLELYLNDSGTAYLSDKIASWQLIDTAIASGDRAEIAAGDAEDSADYALASEQAAKDSADYALASEQAAASSAQFAETEAQESLNSAQFADIKAQEASSSANAASISETNALDSENAASSSEANALSSENAAKTSEDNALASEQAASTSEANAKASENAAKTSEDNALVSENAASDSAQFADIKAQEASSSANAASISEANASSSEDKSQKWAENPENVEVETGSYSALHHKEKAIDAQLAAETSEANALASKQAAETSETNASISASNALASENAASTSETNALASEQAAKTSETNAKASEIAASASETNAENSENTALTAANNASISEQNASDSALAASTSEMNAADSASASESSRLAAEQIFDQFGDRYLGPLTSDPTTDNDGDPLVDGAVYWNTTNKVLKFYTGTDWVAPENVASTYATQAQNSANAASISESNALDSENAASSSEANALSSEQAASVSEDNASTSEANALASENAAKTSETNASTSEANALASENAASTSEANALASENAAKTSENIVLQSETNVTNLENSVSGMYTSFDKRYLGGKTSDPTTDNEGGSLQEGSSYFDTNLNVLKYYTGSSWIAPQEISISAANNASTSEANALASEQAASTSEANAKASENAASTSEANADTSEANALASENKAMAWADNSYGNSVETGKYSARHWAVDAQNSANAASTSESNAAASEFSASNSEDAASTSEANALASENAAQSSELKANSWAENNYGVEVESGKYSAKHWAIDAENSASSASTSASNALASENAAQLSEDNASTSEANALASENAAHSSELKSEKWAEETKDVEVESGKYSAKHYSEYAMQYRDEAQLAAQSLSGGMFFGGEWDASSGSTPPTPTEGSAFYKITAPGTINAVQYAIGDSIVYNNITDTWFKLDGSDKVDSVNGKIGAVVLSTTDVSEGSRQYFTTSRARTAIKTDSSWNAGNWDTAYSWGNHANAGYALDSSISTVGKTGSWNDLLNKPSSYNPSSHTHDASDINSGVLSTARIPVLDYSKASFANQNLNTNSTVKHAEIHTGGATDDGINSLQVEGGTRTDTLAAGGVQNAQESIDTDGNVQVRGEGQLKMGNFVIQYNADTESLSFNMGA